VLGLLATRMNFVVVMTGVGVISLAGVVVNNSIVLVDCFLQHRRSGVEADEAVVLAGRQRLRPVLLTAITTILALVPMALGFSFDFHTWPPTIMTKAETTAFWAPMAVAVIFGLGVASLLTLFQVPVMCSLAESLRKRFVPAPTQ
jgi:multidrug efflux pump